MLVHTDKVLTFKLKEEKYGIPIGEIREIIGMMEISKVPKLPESIKGVINLRGKIIPVVDLRVKFGLEEGAYNDKTSIIITDVGDQEETLCGIIVDTVSEVQYFPDEQIEEPPKCGKGIDQSFLLGMGKHEDEVVMLISIKKLFSDEEMKNLKDKQKG